MKTHSFSITVAFLFCSSIAGAAVHRFAVTLESDLPGKGGGCLAYDDTTKKLTGTIAHDWVAAPNATAVVWTGDPRVTPRADLEIVGAKTSGSPHVFDYDGVTASASAPLLAGSAYVEVQGDPKHEPTGRLIPVTSCDGGVANDAAPGVESPTPAAVDGEDGKPAKGIELEDPPARGTPPKSVENEGVVTSGCSAARSGNPVTSTATFLGIAALALGIARQRRKRR